MQEYYSDLDIFSEISDDIALIPANTTLLRVNFNKYEWSHSLAFIDLLTFFDSLPSCVEILDLSENHLCIDTTRSDIYAAHLAQIFSRLKPNIKTIYFSTTLWSSFNRFSIYDLKEMNNTLPYIEQVRLGATVVNIMSKEALNALRNIFPNAYRYDFVAGDSAVEILLYSPKTYYLHNETKIIKKTRLMVQARCIYDALREKLNPDSIRCIFDYLYNDSINIDHFTPLTVECNGKEIFPTLENVPINNKNYSQIIMAQKAIVTMAIIFLIYKMNTDKKNNNFNNNFNINFYIPFYFFSVYSYFASSIYLGRFAYPEELTIDKKYRYSFFSKIQFELPQPNEDSTLQNLNF